MTPQERCKLCLQALRFTLIRGILYSQGIEGLYRRYITPNKAKFVLEDCHDSACDSHFAGQLTRLKLVAHLIQKCLRTL